MTNDDDIYRGLLEALKIQTTVNQGLQSQIEGLSRMIETLWGGIARAFWPHPVPPRGENIPPAGDQPSAPIPGVEYAHLIGWRRLRA